VDIFT